jgi:hypothetical protein
MALRSSAFGDVLDPRFMRIWDERFTQLQGMEEELYQMVTGKLQTERFSTVGTLGDVPQFGGTVNYDDVYQGYDTTVTALEFAQGIQIERRLMDDAQFSIIEQKPKALAGSMFRTRQAHAVRPFSNAFAVDVFFYNNSEGVPLCSNSHTTTSGASTATGFDNLVTTALSAVSVEPARTQMVNFRGDRAERISVTPTELWVPPDLAPAAFEIVASQGKPDTANNNANFNMGRYAVKEWNYLGSDTNNWFMHDASMRKDFGLVWVERIRGEFAFIEDFDTLVGKWRAYGRWGNAWVDWRWVLGAQVS